MVRHAGYVARDVASGMRIALSPIRDSSGVCGVESLLTLFEELIVTNSSKSIQINALLPLFLLLPVSAARAQVVTLIC